MKEASLRFEMGGTVGLMERAVMDVVCIIVTVNTIGSIGILPVIIILVPYTWNNYSKIRITLLTKNYYYIIHIYAYCTNTVILIHTRKY